MKIVSRWDTGKVLFEDEETELIKCIEHAVREKVSLYGADLRGANLRGANLQYADLQYAYLRGANLRDAYLRDANLQDADLRGANLQYANLHGANLQYAYLRDAYLRDANLQDADLRGANLQYAIIDMDEVPVVDQIDTQILALVEAGKGVLEMNAWHTCETTHCRAGWAIHLAGEAGKKLEEKMGPENAGAFIYLKSCGIIPDFHCSNEVALADMRDRAAKGC
jgi:hypothetical protein